ncbi:MAG: acylphosphatase [bacterium]
MEKSVKLIIKGFVQGVGFRWFVERTARGLGLKGSVKNLPGGSVEIKAKGQEEQLKRLIDYLYDGPGNVSDVEVTYDAQVDEQNFRVRF